MKESKILHRGPRSAHKNPEKREEKVELIIGMKALFFLCRFVFLGGRGVVGGSGEMRPALSYIVEIKSYVR